MSIEKVALLGADGKLGPHILHSLIAHGFKVTVLKRESSKSNDSYPAGVGIERIPDDFSIETVAKILHGQDAVVVTVKGSYIEIQYKLAQACVKAGVKRFIPADFGSCDSANPWAQELVPLFKRKTELREQLIQLAKENGGFTWTSLVCGHFFDWDPAFLHIYVKERKVDVLDDGEVKWSASTLTRIAEATAKILSKPEETKNRVVYVQSFCVSQNEVIRSLESATGSTWEVKKFKSKEYVDEEKAKADDGDLESVENLVWVLGTLDANWESKDGFAMKELGLENEDLDTEVKRVIQENS